VNARTTLEQWRILAAVVDQGGFAQAAQSTHRSQSAISYALANLQDALGVHLLEIRGRKAELTPTGRELLRRSRQIVEQFERLELLAQSLHQGWESELRLVVDAAFPQERLLSVLGELQRSCPNTTISLADAILSGAEEAILHREADLVVTSRVPPGIWGDWLMDVPLIAVAASGHPLHQQGAALALEDLIPHTQVVIRDSGRDHPRDEGWLGAQHRWTVSGIDASIAAVREGFAFAWLPMNRVESLIASGELKPLPLLAGSTRRLPLHVVLVKGPTAGPVARTALELLQRHVPRERA
jgi:DNA-binding transcriptional LysR family regulator